MYLFYLSAKGRIWYKFTFKAGQSLFEFRVFPLQDILPNQGYITQYLYYLLIQEREQMDSRLSLGHKFEVKRKQPHSGLNFGHRLHFSRR